VGKRRTHPYYLSDDEVARERRRTQDMVRGIVGNSHPGNGIEKIDVTSSFRAKGTIKVGETVNFVVDYDGEEKLTIVYGKEAQAECRFKMAFGKDELIRLVDLLKKTYDFF
jgi:hypothetical protein